MEEYTTYETVLIPISSGEEQEFAIMEEFDFEDQHYIVVSPVIEEEIQEGFYLYRASESEDGLEISQIEDEEEFAKVSAYFETPV